MKYSLLLVELLLAGEVKEGKFLIRRRNPGPEQLEFILSVVYRGRPTHRLLAKDAATGALSINGTKMAGVSNMDGVSTA